MNGQALQDSFNLFATQGYKGDIDSYKNLISSNEEAFNDAFSLFSSNGYKGDSNQFKGLVGIENQVKTNDSASADPAVESTEDMGSNWVNGSSGQLDNRFVSENNRGKREKRLKESKYDGTMISRMFDDDPNNSFADNVSESFKDFWKGLEKNHPVFMTAHRTTGGPINPLESIIDGISNWVQKDDAEDEAAIKNNPELFEKYNGYRNDVSLEKQAEQLYNNKDLNISDTDSNLAYNTNKATDFVNEYYINNPESKKLLEEANVSASDFQGFLNRKGYIEEFIKQKEAGGYEEDNNDFFEWMHNDPELNYKDLTMQQDLKMYFDEYLIETAGRNVERVVLEEIKNNPSEYKGMSLSEAMEAADVKLMEDPEKYNYGIHLDFNKLEDWNANNWNSITKYREDQIKNIEEEQATRIEETETGVKTGLYGTARTVAGAVRGVGDGLEDAYDFFKADGKMLGFVYSKRLQANEFRDLREKSNRRALRGEANINYLYAEGKQVTLNGKEYIKQANGNIKQITNGFDVSKTISDKDRKAIDDAIEKGDYTYGSDFDGFGGSIIAGQTIGELAIQVLGQKGVGSLRKLASLKYLGKAKNLSKARLDRMKAGVNSKGNMRGVNYGGVTGGAKGTWDTFGKKIPLGISKGMADAIIFQTGYGAMTGYNQAKKAALDAGMSMEESEAIANEASLGMAALFAVTTPINPRTGLIDKIFKKTGKNSTANLFKQLINVSGNAAGVRKNFGKIVAAPLQTKLAKFSAIVASEGGKELVQENVQQVGEAALNKVLNKGIGKDLLKDTYTYEDFVNTSVLSFAAGGFAGGVGNISTLAGRKNIMNDSEKVQKLRQLMQNPAKVEKIFDSWVKNGDITRKEADGLNQEIQKFGRNINKMPKFLSDRRMSTELLKVIDSQENISKLEQQRKNAIPGEQALIDEKLKVLKEQQTKLLVDAQTTLDADNEVFEGKFTKNTAAVVKFARKLGFGESKLPKIFENTDAYVTAIYSALKIKEQTYLKAVKEGKIKADPDFKPLTKAEVERLAAKSDGVYLGAGNLFINKEIARQTGKWTVTSHEIIHPILNSLVGSYLNQKANYDDLMKILPAKVRSSINKKIAQTQGKEKQATEFLNYLSDAVISGELDYDPSLFDKIRLWLNNIISKLGIKSGIENHEDLHFDDARGVYNWLKEFTSSLKEGGEISDKAVEAVQKAETKTGRLVSEDPGLRDPENAMQFSKTLSPDVEADLTSKILEVKKLAKENEEIAKKFGKDPIPGAKQIRLENEIRQGVKPIIEKVVTNRTKALYDPIAPDQKRNVSREEFQDSMRTDIETMILNEFKEGGNTLEKFIVDRSYLRANDLAKRLGIEDKIKTSLDTVDSEGKETIQVASDYNPETTMTEIRFEENRKKKLIDPRKVFGQARSKEYTEAVKDAISEMTTADFDLLSFASIKDLAPAVTAEFWKTTVKKVVTASANLSSGEIPSIQGLILKNADTFIALLPEGSILEGETASENLIGTGVGVPRKLQQVFYNKGERTSKGAGLIPFTLKKGITKGDFLAAFGISEDGTFAKFGGKDPRAQTMLALIRLYGQITSNTAIRELADLTGEQNANIRAGAAQIQFSKSANEAIFAEYKITENDRAKLFSIMINSGGVFSEKAKKYLDKFTTDLEIKNNILSEVTHEGIIAMMQDIEASNSGIKYEKALQKALNKLSPNFKVEFIKGKKGDLIITGLKGFEFKIEVKLNNKAQISSLNIGLFEIKDGEIKLKNLEKETLKLSKKISEDNTKLLIDSLNENKEYLENIISTINDLNKSLKEKIKLNRGGHIKLPKNTEMNNKPVAAEDLWAEIKKRNNNKAGYFSYDSDHTIVEDLYSSIDLIEIGEQGAYAIGKKSKASKFYNSLEAEMNNTVRPVKTSESIYFRLFPNFKKIINKKSNSLSTKEGIEKLSNIVSGQFSKTLDKDFNNIIEDSTGIDSFKRFSEAKGKVRGRDKGRFKFFIPPSADDFAGLLYNLTAKGAKGEAAQAWFKENLFDPFSRGINEFERYKQRTTTLMRDLKKKIKNVPEGLKKINETGFKNEDAVRIYLWAKKGVDIPGLSKTDQKELIKIINDNPKLKEFADQIDALVNGYPDPQNDWLAGTITTDIINLINTSKREEFLTEWQANIDEIFSKENINKLRAAFGDNYVEALQDMLYRMKSGRNRPYGANKLTNQFMNWVNDSVGTIMFFNTRSALLQTLSMTNFINWGDNNPIMTAKAFANQKQFWSDFAMLFNSDFLKQRRSGLKNDVNADDIAAAAETSQNKAKAVLASILKMGFLPTQIADSFAIAMGGASFIRNRINTYVSKGMDQASAEKQAFLDFQEIAEETQQSSRPDRISQQQASPLGRIILAFANTPMQYMRLTKKAFLDLKNGRGDVKTNISKIAYYFAVQNIIFSSLQAALFSVLFEDEDDEEIDKKQLSIANSMLDSILRGVGIYGAIASTLKNVVLEVKKQSEKDRPDFTIAAQRALSISPPVDSKMRKLMSAGRAFSYKTTREKMKGFGLDNPAYYAVGQVVSATTNIPVDRIVRKADNIRVALDNDTKYWQKIALLLGYSQWDVNLVETSKDKKEKSKFGSTTKWKKKTWKK